MKQTKPQSISEVIQRGNFVVLDTETTGLDDRAEICQIAIVNGTGFTLVNTLIKPRFPIPDQAIKIHGITNAMVQRVPVWPGAAARILSEIRGRDLIIYNAEYDLRIMQQTASLWGMELELKASSVHCAMLAYADYFGDWDDYRQSNRWQKLDVACRQQNLSVESPAHSALGDCLRTLALIKHCWG